MHVIGIRIYRRAKLGKDWWKIMVGSAKRIKWQPKSLNVTSHSAASRSSTAHQSELLHDASITLCILYVQSLMFMGGAI